LTVSAPRAATVSGALSFVRDGQRVITTTGMGLLGFVFYLLLAVALIALA